jgi:hypothetical protein
MSGLRRKIYLSKLPKSYHLRFQNPYPSLSQDLQLLLHPMIGWKFGIQH